MPLSTSDRIGVAKWLNERGYKVTPDDHAEDLLACMWNEISLQEQKSVASY